MTGEHPAITSFRAALHREGGTGRVVVLPDAVHTAALAAQALGCEVGAIANSLVFDADGSPALILTSGAHRVDTGKVIGGVSPIDLPAPVPTFLDTWLRRYDEIWAAAGHASAVFSTTYDELLRITGAREIAVA